ncbi:MAG TPA: arginyltransferase [Tepidisphaeraceae bacterium]|jgi:arginine-tRNA-protein transferase
MDPPVPVAFTTLPPHTCSYLPDREATLRAFSTRRMPGLLYHDFLNASFRRSGLVIYQPVCEGCRECIPLRIPVEEFRPSKSQRRCRVRNQDLVVEITEPLPTDEKFDLYTRYQSHRHPGKSDSRANFEDFLYHSPVQTLEFNYRDGGGDLLAVGICDICPKSLSSVYFYFDPAQGRRGLGTFGILHEIDFAAREKIPHYYLGYWVRQCAKMAYKADFKPCEILAPDGSWQACDE